MQGVDNNPNRWRGKRGEAAKVVRFRWQKDWTQQSTQRLRIADHWRRLRVGVLLVTFLALLAALVYYLLYQPVLTPLVTISAPPYEWPLPVNAWAKEDLAGLKSLHDETLSVKDLSDAWTTKERGLQNFDNQLQAVVAQGSRSHTVVIYVSMHGVVDGAGTPCLVPPGASPLKSETWLPLPELLDRIKALELPSDWNKLLILDCNRLAVEPQLGQLYNGFADRLPEVVNAAAIPHLAVLNSTSPGQIGWSSPQLQGSVFGHFLQLGLAGAADAKPETIHGVKTEGGNGDHRVSLHELHRYLLDHVDHWVSANRAVHQQPMLLPEGVADFEVAWAAKKSRRDRQASTIADPQRVEATVSAADIGKLWRSHDALAAYEPYRFDPVAWSNFEHKLLWLDQAAGAGQGYANAARHLLTELQGSVGKMEKRAAAAADEPSVFARASIISTRAAQRPETMPVHSLALAEYFGLLNGSDVTGRRAALLRFSTAPTRQTLTEALTGIEPAHGTLRLGEAHYLRLMQRWLPASAWQQPPALAAAATTLDDSLRVAVPNDERAQYWIRSTVSAADATRRTATDHLFTGTEADLTTATESLAQAGRQYRQAQTLSDQVTAAIKLRDQANAELPYLTQWLTRPVYAGQATDEIDRDVNESLLRLIDGVQSLDQALESPPDGDQASDGPPAFADQLTQCAQLLKHLEQSFAQQCTGLLQEKKPDARTLHEMQAALALPLLSARQRDDLGRAAAQLSLELAQKEDAPVAADDTKAEVPKSTQGARYLERMDVKWDKHPVLALLGNGQTDAEAASHAKRAGGDTSVKELPAGQREAAVLDAALKGQAVRDLLGSVPVRVREQLDREPGTEIEVGPADAGFRQLRTHFRTAQQMVRAAASIGLPALEEDPIARLRQLDWQQLLFWQCQRTLDDFWGPAEDEQPAFFRTAAADYLRDAQAVREVDAAVHPQLKHLSELLDERQAAARAGLRTTAADLLLVSEAEDVSINGGVRAGPNDAAHGLPPGQATFLITDAQGPIAGAARPIPLPLPSADAATPLPIDFSLGADALNKRGPVLQAVALFRGNRFATPFLLHATSGAKVDFTPFQYGPPKITLGGRSRKRASVEFILDCSESMHLPTEMEGPGGGHLSRLDVAKAALEKMLQQLAAQGDARVGVRLFGHRVGWSTKTANQRLVQTTYGRPIPDNLQPSEDVEAILPLGRFDEVVAGGVSDSLKSVKPWGETPVYLALVQACADFATEDPGTEKSIVVITDGVNYQFNSPNPKTKNDVLSAVNGKKISIHIVGFNISADESAEAKREFGRLADETGGSYTAATSATSLVKSLESLLGPSLYGVADAGGHEVGRAQVGTPIELPPVPEKGREYTVTFGQLSRKVQAYEGDSLELALSRDSKSIDTVRYDKGNPQFSPLVRGTEAAPTGLLAGIHRPAWQSRGVRFPVSFQRDDGALARRPAECWIEVQPIIPDKHGPVSKYIFYDVNFEPAVPVPLLNWTAEDWPTAVRQAEIRVWCKPEKTKANWTVKLNDAVEHSGSGGGAALPGLSDFTYQVRTKRELSAGDPYRIGIVERHGEGTPLDALKLEMFPQAQRVVHTFDAENRLVIHTFYFDKFDPQTLSAYELRFTKREALHADAWHMIEPVRVSVSEPGDVIRLSPATGTP